MSVTRSVTFTEENVENWCEENNDRNPIHIDTEAASEMSFGQRVVPGIMLLDKLSGMITEWGDGDEVVLAGVTAARFRDPVLLGEEVTLHLNHAEDLQNFTALDFEATVEDRGSLVATGSFSVVVQ